MAKLAGISIESDGNTILNLASERIAETNTVTQTDSNGTAWCSISLSFVPKGNVESGDFTGIGRTDKALWVAVCMWIKAGGSIPEKSSDTEGADDT